MQNNNTNNCQILETLHYMYPLNKNVLFGRLLKYLLLQMSFSYVLFSYLYFSWNIDIIDINLCLIILFSVQYAALKSGHCKFVLKFTQLRCGKRRQLIII